MGKGGEDWKRRELRGDGRIKGCVKFDVVNDMQFSLCEVL